MITDDSVTPAERLYPHRRRYPWLLALIALLFLAYGVADAVTSWGDRVEHIVTLNCGI